MTELRAAISFDEMLDALAHVQRRTLLVALLDHNPQDDAPGVVADSEDEADAVERLVAMDHVHLPKLAKYGFIEWNQDTHEVAKGPAFDDVRPLLELLVEHGEDLPSDWL